MTSAAKSTYVYVTYIRSTPEKVWAALTDADTMRQIWFGSYGESDWKAGSSWRLVATDGLVTDAGEILEADPPRRLVIKWRNEFRPELKAEGYGRCTMEIAQESEAVKLTVTHEIDVPDAKLITAVSGGWPRILSNLKSLLETGAPVMRTKNAA